LALGERSAATALADEQLTLARVVAGPRALARTLRAAAACHTDPTLLHEALELVAEDRGLERVRVLFELGSLERRAGRPAVARRYLDQAWDLAQRLGATVTATRVREELRVAGGRPRRGFVSGPEALTAGERRVARLAADGRSNVEIAQALFVTTKTVEKHLGSTYRKLDVSSRAQLPEALAADPVG
jgi:DNA-binding CsgD family transcriptional regulator